MPSFSTTPKTITVNYTPHEGQQEVSDALINNFSKKEQASVASYAIFKSIIILVERIIATQKLYIYGNRHYQSWL